MDLLIAEEVARQAAEEIARLRDVIARLNDENARLRAELCEKQK